MAATSKEHAVPPAVDFEVTPVQGQLGSVTIDLNGNVVRHSGLICTNQASLLYKMLSEVGMLKEDGGFKRMTVSFQNTRYSVTRDQLYVYIVQTQIS